MTDDDLTPPPDWKPRQFRNANTNAAIGVFPGEPDWRPVDYPDETVMLTRRELTALRAERARNAALVAAAERLLNNAVQFGILRLLNNAVQFGILIEGRIPSVSVFEDDMLDLRAALAAARGGEAS